MKKLFTFAIALILMSCTTDAVEEPQAIPPTYTICGTPNAVMTLFTTGSPSTFVGVLYFVQLDTPYNYLGVDYTRAGILINDAQNTATIQQYANGSWTPFCTTRPNISITNWGVNSIYLFN